MVELFQYLFSDLTANMRIMASRISLSLMILMDEDRVHCEEKKQWKTASTWQFLKSSGTCAAPAAPHQSGPYLRNPLRKWAPGGGEHLIRSDSRFDQIRSRFDQIWWRRRMLKAELAVAHLGAGVVMPPERSNLVLSTHVLKETMIRIHYHFSIFLLPLLILSLNFVITEEWKTARFNELISGRLPYSREPLPGWNWTLLTSNATVSLILKHLV